MDKKFLSKFVPLNSLTSDNFKVLSEEAKIESLPTGSRLFSQGDVDSDILYLLEGEVFLSTSKTARLHSVQAGSDTARYPLAQLKPRQFTGSAKTPVTLARVDSHLLDLLITWDQSTGYEVSEIGGNQETDWVTRLLRGEVIRKLPPAHINALLARFQPYAVKAGQIVIRQGDPGEFYYAIKSGRADVLRKSKTTHKVEIVASLSEGQGFGEEALLSGAPRNATVVMQADGCLMRLNRRDFNELLTAPLVKWLSPTEVQAAVHAGAKLLDVRFRDEFLTGTIKGSVNFPLQRLRENLAELDPKAVYIVFCQTGSLSCAAAFLLIQHGFTVSVLRGGLDQLTRKR